MLVPRLNEAALGEEEILSRQMGDPEHCDAVAGVKVDDAVRGAVMVCIDRLNAESEEGCWLP